MRFTCSVTVNQPLEKVIELFDNPDNLKEWQDGFVSFTHKSGRPGQPGAKSRLVYKMGKGNKEMELIETIIKNDLPREFSTSYEHIHMTNTMTSRFISNSPNQTTYEADIEYTKFNGFVIKLMVWLMPRMFKKQVQKWMDQFKAFAEREGV